MMKKRWWGQSAACWITLLGIASATQAASFSVSPVRVDLSPRQLSQALIVRNESNDKALVLQLQTVSWSQEAGKDIYLPTTALLATPPIFTIPAGAIQVIRVASLRPPVGSEEKPFRLLLREVPGPARADTTGVQIALEIHLPVFLKPLVASTPDLHWRARLEPEGHLRLSLENKGNAHVQVANLVLTALGSAETVASETAFSYVLAQQSRDWLFKLNLAKLDEIKRGVRLKALSDSAAIDIELIPESH